MPKVVLVGVFTAALALLVMALAAQQPQGGPEAIPAHPGAFVEPSEAEAPVKPVPAPKAKGAARTHKIDLHLAYGKADIGGQPLHLRLYNGKITGPTVRVRAGDTLDVHLKNDLPCLEPHGCKCEQMERHHPSGPPDPKVFNTTNLHTHGLHISPSNNSDNVLLSIEPGCSFDYRFTIPKDHPAGTDWYHPHVHGSTAIQVSSGDEGALIVEGDFDQALGIPYSPDPEKNKDHIFLFQQIAYHCDGDTCKPGEEGKVEDFKKAFGPRVWHTSKRFTTVNGAVQPLIKMRPGEVQRWRFIHGGVRESLEVAVVDSVMKDVDAQGPTLYEVALDGIPTGGIERKATVDLEPGYRSDVLVQAGRPAHPTRYYLIDRQTPAADSLLLEAEPRKVLAVIEVGGKPCEAQDPTCVAQLPPAARLAHFRPPSIHSVTAPGQHVEFDIDRTVTPNHFLVNGKTYDLRNPPRTLTLGRAEEWRITSKFANHPFHIHVNPFEVIETQNGVEKRYWKDTILVRPDKPIRFYTRYEDFDGKFVLHCHILDHEDQGMMEVVEIKK